MNTKSHHFYRHNRNRRACSQQRRSRIRQSLAVLVVALSMVGYAEAAPPGQGALGDKQMFQQIQQSMSAAAATGYANAVAQQRAIAECEPCSPEGEQYQRFAIEFLNAQAAAKACQEIPKENPTLGGVNAFLTCIHPINLLLIALNNQMAAIGSAVASSNCTVSGNPHPAVTPHFNAVMVWVKTVSFVEQIKSLKEVGSLAVDLKQITSGAKAWPLAKGARYHGHNPSFEDALVLTESPEVSIVLELAKFPAPQLGIINLNLAGGGAELPGVDPSVSPLYGGPVLPSFALPNTAASGMSLASQGAVANTGTRVGNTITQDTSSIALAVARQDAPVSLGFLPDWTTLFLQAFERGRLAQSQGLRGILGLPPRASEVPPPNVAPGLRLTPQPGVLDLQLAAALNAILEQHDAIADALEQFRSLLATTTDLVSDRQALGSLAAVIVHLLKNEPVLRARAVGLLTATPGMEVNAVLVSPWYLGLNVTDILADATLNEANRTATIAFTEIAQELGFPTTGLVSAILPSGRSVQVGATATAFGTIINTGSVTATACSISFLTSHPATLIYQTTDPATNQVIGMPNKLVNITGGAAQSFVLAVTPTAPIAPTDLQFSFACANTDPAPINTGLNTLLLSASVTPVPDIVALAATSGGGIVNIPGANATGAFAVATVNVGAGGNITVSADTGSATLPVNIFLCETNPATGQCISAIDSNVTTTINANATPTFGIFVQGNGNVPFDPAGSRIFVLFKDAGGVTRGSTSVAVRTQ